MTENGFKATFVRGRQCDETQNRNRLPSGKYNKANACTRSVVVGCSMKFGSIVRCRNRDWVLMPSGESQHFCLRPLTGATDETVVMHRGLANLVGMNLPGELLGEASFPVPTSDDLADAASAYLLWQAARLTLRESMSAAITRTALHSVNAAKRADRGIASRRAF
jgi:hypothetical protein